MIARDALVAWNEPLVGAAVSLCTFGSLISRLQSLPTQSTRSDLRSFHHPTWFRSRRPLGPDERWSPIVDLPSAAPCHNHVATPARAQCFQRHRDAFQLLAHSSMRRVALAWSRNCNSSSRCARRRNISCGFARTGRVLSISNRLR